MADGCSPVECGYCLRKGDNLEEPKRLACGHIHCLPCLLEALEVNGVVTCPACKHVLNTHPKELLAASVSVEKSQNLCDSCTKNGLNDIPAICYCPDDSCKKKYCSKHMEFHNELMGDHKVISLSEYSRATSKHERKHCVEHSSQPLIMACRRCKLPLCVDCLEDETACQGLAHQAAPLKLLFNEVKGRIRNLEKQAMEKKEKLSALSKQGDRVLCEFDSETEELMKQIHEARDEQLKALREGYTALELQLSEERRGTRKEILQFKETLVDAQITQLSNGVKKMVDGLTNGHEADVVGGYKELSAHVQSLTDSDVPSMTSSAPTTVLTFNGKHRQVELKTKAGATIKLGRVSESSNVKHSDPQSKEKLESQQPMPRQRAHAGWRVPSKSSIMSSKGVSSENTVAAAKTGSADASANAPSAKNWSEDLTSKAAPPAPSEGRVKSSAQTTSKPKDTSLEILTLSLDGRTMSGRATDVFGFNCIQIHYTVEAGRQKVGDPRPGQPYDSVRREAYLLDDDKGRRLLKLLGEAFKRGLTFKVGADGKLDWNIEHKTSLWYIINGSEYRQYMDQVNQQLRRLGVEEFDWFN